MSDAKIMFGFHHGSQDYQYWCRGGERERGRYGTVGEGIVVVGR